MLRYATIMQRGVKQASDAYARVMASVGSLERVVELHDRGVFRDAAKSLGTEEFPVRFTTFSCRVPGGFYSAAKFTVL